MSLKSKRIIVNLLVGLIVIIGYIIYSFNNGLFETENLKEWATATLIFIGVAVIASIIIQIVFNIIFSIGMAIELEKQSIDDEGVEKSIEVSMAEDEMDRLISLKSGRIGYTSIGIGFVLVLISIEFGATAILAFNILLGMIALGTILEGIVSVYMYERGVKNG